MDENMMTETPEEISGDNSKAETSAAEQVAAKLAEVKPASGISQSVVDAVEEANGTVPSGAAQNKPTNSVSPNRPMAGRVAPATTGAGQNAAARQGQAGTAGRTQAQTVSRGDGVHRQSSGQSHNGSAHRSSTQHHSGNGKGAGRSDKTARKQEAQLNLFRFLTIILLLVLIVVLGCWGIRLYRENRAENQYDTMQEQVNHYQPIQVTDGDLTTEVETETQEPESGIVIPEKNLDWEELRQENQDIYAWIYIPGTNVDYPVVQHPSDDTYYLDHNLDGSKGYPGCIYTQSMNRKDFTDFNTVIYGHHMKTGSMLKTIHAFEEEDFFLENQYLYIYTDKGPLVYHIYAAYETDNAHILNTNDFTSEEGINAYLKKAYLGKNVNGYYRDGVEITAENRIVTLSTCIAGKSSRRYVVQGVLMNAPYVDYGAEDMDTESLGL